MTHAELKKLALQNTNVRSEYEALEPEFTLVREMLKARKEAGLSQADVAKRMGTKAPAVTRLEASLTTGKHSPSVETVPPSTRWCTTEQRRIGRVWSTDHHLALRGRNSPRS
jgi:DNA-binding XRE family transcriptional regulator